MLRDELKNLVESAVDRLVKSGKLPEAAYEVPVEISDTKTPEHGDYACNYALTATKKVGLPPRQVGEVLRGEMVDDTAVFDGIDVAGPGFINFRLNPAYVSSFVAAVLEKGTAYVRPRDLKTSRSLRLNVEFVSVNPNGPITVGSGRGAAFGSTLCNVLTAAGNEVHREYYINDGVNSEQMRLFAESVKSYALGLPFPENGYRGEYVKDVAEAVADGDPSKPIGWWQSRSQSLMLERQRVDLALFGVEFDTWFSEQSLHDRGVVSEQVSELEAKGVADTEPHQTVLKLGKNGKVEDVEVVEQPIEEVDDEFEAAPPPTPSPVSPSETKEGGTNTATLWLRSTKFGDDKDRVLRRRDGRLTYIASDVAYHADKFNRPPNADKLITILGPDHHGYIGRLHAVLAALLESSASTENSDTAVPMNELEARIYRSPEERDACVSARELSDDKLEVVIFQIVRFLKDGKPAPMRKRDGNIYELRDLVNELGAAMAPDKDRSEQQRIGRDVARFFYLTRSHDTHLDFDIDLATKQSDENPVFYAQYAHARICSVLRKAEEAGIAVLGSSGFAEEAELTRLQHAKESALIKKILDLPMEVGRCAEDYGVHRLTTYAVELARAYHHFYDACRVIQPDQPELTQARLALCQAARTALKATFDLLGVSAPEKM